MSVGDFLIMLIIDACETSSGHKILTCMKWKKRGLESDMIQLIRIVPVWLLAPRLGYYKTLFWLAWAPAHTHGIEIEIKHL